MSEHPELLAWVDLETTGLEPTHDRILEVGLVLTDTNLDLVDAARWYVGPVVSVDEMDTFVYEMHAKSGLLDDLDGCDDLPSAETVAFRAAYWLHDHWGINEEKMPMCGSSVHFDRAFLKVHMPDLHAMFGYRNIDASVFRELAKRWCPDYPVPEKNEVHRVLPDLTDTVELARAFKPMFTDWKAAA